MTEVRALIVPASDEHRVIEVNVEGSYEGVKSALGAASADMVDLGESVAVWVDGSGRLTGLPVNPRASRLINSFIPGWTRTDMVHGAALFVGLDQETAEYSNVPEFVVTRQSNIN